VTEERQTLLEHGIRSDTPETLASAVFLSTHSLITFGQTTSSLTLFLTGHAETNLAEMLLGKYALRAVIFSTHCQVKT